MGVREEQLPPIDWTLTPENASARSYQWIDDVFLERVAELQVLLTDEQLCLGAPRAQEEGMAGLYIPFSS
jgi:hypothetical protein